MKTDAKVRAAAYILVIILSIQACAHRRKLSIQERMERAARVESLLLKTVHLLRVGDAESLSGARAALLLARELHPNDPRVSDGLGCVSWRKGEWGKAESYFEEAHRSDPYYDRALSHLALAAERKGETAKARKLYEQALALQPLNHRSRNNFAALLFDNADTSSEKAFAQSQLQMAVSGRDELDEVLLRNLKLMKTK